MKEIVIAICAGFAMIGLYSYFGLGVEAPESIKTVLVLFLIFGISGLLGVFGMVPGVKSSSQRVRDRERIEADAEKADE